MQLLRLIKMVLWSFFGIRKRAGLESDVKNTNPLHVIIVGIIATAVFVGVLVGVVKTAMAVLT